MDKLCSRLEEVITYIHPHLPLANSHMVNFITNKHWDAYFPNEMKIEITDYKEEDIFKLFWNQGETHLSNDSNIFNFLSSTHKMSINANDGICISISDLKNKFLKWGHSCESSIKLEQFMSSKKTHEVEVMSFLVATLSTLTESSHVIDIGGGKGYLSSILALGYQLKVLGLDSCQTKTLGAAKRARDLRKVWNGSRKKIISESTSEINSELSVEEVKPPIEFMYKQSTEFVSEDTNIPKIISKEFPEDSDYKIGLIGLHTCGNLSPVCLKQFVKNYSSIEFIVNVGCCHHLLSEEFIPSQGISFHGFPLSNFLRRRKFTLGRNARMLSLQALSRIASFEKMPSESLMFRAVLQQLLIEKLGIDNIPRGQVGRIAEKCVDFTDYVHKAITKLGLNLQVSDKEIQDCYARNEIWKTKLNVYFMLRASLAPVLENIILLDRLIFLKEQGVYHSYLVQMFDPVVSPRCYGLVALRDRTASLQV